MEATTPGSASADNPSTSRPSNHPRDPRHPFAGRRRPPRSQSQREAGPANSESRPAAVASDTSGAQDTTNRPPQQPRRYPPRHKKPQTQGQSPGPTDASPAEHSSANGPNPNRRRHPRKPQTASTPAMDSQVSSDPPQGGAQPGKPGGGSRRSKFRGKLTENDGPSNPSLSSDPSRKYRSKRTEVLDDLTSRLIRELSSPPYPDCPICFSSVHREQPIWSCSPSIPTILPPGAEGPPQYCWTTFHLKCIRSWASKSVKDVEDAWRTRGEEGRTGDWRCPGCQGKREVVPKVYWCFCGSIPDPKSPRLATPHSCGGPCTRIRESGCGHPCPLTCHPGPCPPCQVTTRVPCYCPRKSIIAFRCGVEQDKLKGKNLTCGNVCGRTLPCGKHTCQKICHEESCGDCPIRESARCWCGKTEKELACGEGDAQECSIEGEMSWTGRFACDQICERSFDCGIHKCQKACHPPSHKPAPCPQSPTNVAYCPCGKSTIAPSPDSNLSHYTFPARTSCTSPIPTCDNTCSKIHSRCGHSCPVKCHIGPCPPCSVQVMRPCRCGSSTKSLPCHELYNVGTDEEVEILCDRPCTALRACGRHECRRPCCPLASLAIATGGKKGKKKLIDVSTNAVGIGEERGGLHECDLVCGKPLSCGNHRCEERDHKRACPPCLRSSFEEMSCHCGRTVYEPPIPCGTVMRCPYPCTRPPPLCGHSHTPHSCHEDPTPCPPCFHLTAKPCACGKKIVQNVRCSLESEKVSCGTICGKLLGCGFHHCERSCHADDCGKCTATCGKLRRLCLPDHHLCPLPCHAPSSCPETEPCSSLVTVTCPCGRVKQSVRCGRSSSTPSPSRPRPKCTNDCGIAKRNARLAEALGITTAATPNIGTSASPQTYGGLVNTANYSDDVIGFARVNMRFLAVVEKAFAEFVVSPKRTQVLPHMPLERRKFVLELATYYRIDTQLVDQEPHRSVQLHRRLDTRIPSPLLSALIQSSASNGPNLGKLGDLRNPKAPVASTASTSASSGNSGSPWRHLATPSPRPTTTGTTAVPGASNAGENTLPGASGASHGGWSSIVSPQPQRGGVLTTTKASGWSDGSGSLIRPGSGSSRPRSVGVASRPSSAVQEVAAVVDEHVRENWEDEE